jgi:MoaA/NifB/PqqE/SkfB family radical SAM enzyme
MIDSVERGGKFFKLGMAALKNNFTELDHPYKLNFCITYRCQSRCKTCNIWQLRPKNELWLGEIQEFAQKNPYFRWLQLTGGEPFLRKEIAEIAKTFLQSSKGLYVISIPTNSLCDRELVIDRVRQILELGVPKLSITVSLDGYRELHDEIRGVPGNYDKAIALFKDLRELSKKYRNLHVVFGYTICKYNQGQFQKTFDEVGKELPGLRYDDFHINLAQYSEHYYKNAGLEFASESAKTASELRQIAQKREVGAGAVSLIERAFLNKLVRFVESGKSPVKSRSLDASLFLDSEGNVFPSIMWDRKIGNIRDAEYDLDRIWKGDEAMAARQMIQNGQEPQSWTACEAHQALVGNVKELIV